MEPTCHDLASDIRAQYAELLNLAATIDHYAQAQRLSGNLRASLSFLAMHALFDAVPATEEDYSDLSPNPPDDPTAWRGAQFRTRRNALSLAFSRSTTE
jgi:hypothetical protein